MTQDPFTAMRATFTLQRLLPQQRARRGEQNLPPLLTCRDVLEFATVAGARCACLDSKARGHLVGVDWHVSSGSFRKHATPWCAARVSG